MSKNDFRGEVWNNIDQKVLEKIVEINAEAVDGKVGHDSYTAKATKYLQSFYGFFVVDLKKPLTFS